MNIQEIINNMNGITLSQWEELKRAIDLKFKETAKLNLSNEELERFKEYLQFTVSI